jgi:predicted membrane channel-forming protein YqfA (hemolysin III family)
MNLVQKQEVFMTLSAPTMVVFIISLVLALLGVLAGLAVIPALPVAAFWIVVIGYIVLAAGCLLKGV